VSLMRTVVRVFRGGRPDETVAVGTQTKEAL